MKFWFDTRLFVAIVPARQPLGIGEIRKSYNCLISLFMFKNIGNLFLSCLKLVIPLVKDGPAILRYPFCLCVIFIATCLTCVSVFAFQQDMHKYETLCLWLSFTFSVLAVLCCIFYHWELTSSKKNAKQPAKVEEVAATTEKSSPNNTEVHENQSDERKIELRAGVPRNYIQGLSTPPEMKEHLILTEPIDHEICRQLREDLKLLRKDIIPSLKLARKMDLDENNFRVNIFLPKYAFCHEGFICELAIHPILQVGMDNHPDLKITFRPGQSYVGKAFAQHLSAYGLVKPGKSKSDYTNALTREQEALMLRKLKWVIAVPLLVRVDSEFAVGALCLDGKDWISQAEFDELNALAIAFVGTIISPLLERLPKTRICVITSKVPHEHPEKSTTPIRKT